jgi:hypothetical protein
MDQQEIIDMIQPHFEALESMYNNSMVWVNSIMDTHPTGYFGRTKATLLHNRVANLADEYFRDMPDIDSDKKYESIQIIFEKKVSVKFKKINKKSKLSSNIPTNRIVGMLSQQYSLFPEENIKLEYVEAGYIVNQTWTDIEKIILLFRMNNNIIWSYEISGSGNIGLDTNPITTNPVDPTPTPTTESETQIKIKKQS